MLDAIGVLVEVRAQSSYLGQLAYNIFQYEVVSEVGLGVSMLEFLTQFVVDIVTPVSQLQSELYIWQSLTGKTLDPFDEVADHTFSQAGIGTGEPLPAFMAMSFKLNRLSPITRPGYKRFGGVSEGSLTDALWTFDVGDLVAVEEALADPIAVSGDDGSITVRPVIIGRTALGTYDFARVNPVTSASLQPAPTTQNSRKFF